MSNFNLTEHREYMDLCHRGSDYYDAFRTLDALLSLAHDATLRAIGGTDGPDSELVQNLRAVEEELTRQRSKCWETWHRISHQRQQRDAALAPLPVEVVA